MDQPVEQIDAAIFRRVMGRFATGVTLIAARWPDGGVHAMTANAFMSGSLNPPLCVVSVAKQANMHACLESAGRFSVSILAEGQEDHSNHFAGEPVAGLSVDFGDVDGIPVLAGVVAHILARSWAVHDCGDHSLFVGEVVALSDGVGNPLLYLAGRYGSFRQGETKAGVEAPSLW